jgi:hypothetical protein
MVMNSDLASSWQAASNWAVVSIISTHSSIKQLLNFLLLSAGYVNTFADKALAAFRFWLKLSGAMPFRPHNPDRKRFAASP